MNAQHKKSAGVKARVSPRTAHVQRRSSSPSRLQKLFEEELKDIYWVEKALVKAISKMIKNCTSEQLSDALEKHLDETEYQVGRVEKVFSFIDTKAVAKKCESMAGLIKESEEMMASQPKGFVRDAAIIAAAQKVEHYEIASYGSLCAFAKTLGLEKAFEILNTTLEEEKGADAKLSMIGESSVNVHAGAEDGVKEKTGISRWL
jgi:ferritin-like metal-binding protein YciE